MSTFYNVEEIEKVGTDGDGGGIGSLLSGSRQWHIEFTLAQFSSCTFPEQAVKQFTSSTRCLLLGTSVYGRVERISWSVTTKVFTVISKYQKYVGS